MEMQPTCCETKPPCFLSKFWSDRVVRGTCGILECERGEGPCWDKWVSHGPFHFLSSAVILGAGNMSSSTQTRGSVSDDASAQGRERGHLALCSRPSRHTSAGVFSARSRILRALHLFALRDFRSEARGPRG